MAALNESPAPGPGRRHIPRKVSRAWVVNGTSLPVKTVMNTLVDLSIDEVIEQIRITHETRWRRSSLG